MFTIGCHLSSAKGYLHMAKDAVSIDANTFQFFTRNPRGGRAKAIDPKDVAAYAAYAPEHGIERILAHAPYTLNPASDKQQTRDFALMVLAEDLGRMEETPHQLYNMHPGSAVGQAHEAAIAKIADALNQSRCPSNHHAAAGDDGGERQRDRRHVRGAGGHHRAGGLESHVGVCLTRATCDAGYDIVATSTACWRSSDRVIGLDRLHAIHLNDSMNARGSHKDRHARIGEGEIGFKALAAVTNHPKLRDLPFYLRPQPDLAGYAEEIAVAQGA
ncbi:MAG: deoxyribonuclease IV [Eggerthellaceae bacterium]